MQFTTDFIIVRYSETDQMQFVHHSNYLKFFELARLEWLEDLGISYADMEKQGVLMPVVSASLAFKKPLHFGDRFRVTVMLKKKPVAKMEFDYFIENQNQEMICTGNTVLAFLSTKTKRPMRCPKELSDPFG
ncbi:MAG: thioesterase family protein [Flavobacteriaceae bacterium]